MSIREIRGLLGVMVVLLLSVCRRVEGTWSLLGGDFMFEVQIGYHLHACECVRVCVF